MTTDEQPITVAMGKLGAVSSTFQHERRIALPLADAVARLRAAIEANDLWVLHEIDPQAIVRKGGYAIPGARQILCFHPRLMVRLLAADPSAILEVPLKFALLEEAGGVRLRWLDPLSAFDRYGNGALAELGGELRRTCDRIADELVAVIAAPVAA